MRCVCNIVLGLIILISSASFSFSQEIEIEWEVKHKFRFFPVEPNQETSIFYRMQEAAWNEIYSSSADFNPEMAVSLLERKLNDQAWLQKFYVQYQSELGITDDQLERGGHARWGWAKHIISNNLTCWDWRRQWHSSCSSDAIGQPRRSDYVMPQRHTVVARLKGIDTSSDSRCTWSVEETSVFLGESRNVKSITRPCSDEVQLRIPYHADENMGTVIEVTSADNSDQFAQKSTKITVTDILVVGIGDSFSSGEGNPDVPVIMDSSPRFQALDGSVVYQNRTTNAYSPQAFDNDARTALVPAFELDQYSHSTGNASLILPHRQFLNTPARWMDRNCHRSLYSYHTRTALQLSLTTNKQTAVTFLGYACSGSKLTDGILLEYDGIERVNPRLLTREGKMRRKMPQLARLIEELCKSEVSLDQSDWNKVADIPTGDKDNRSVKPVKMPVCGEGRTEDYLRPIDLMIFSIGGNDVGFLPIIVDTMLSGTKTFDEAGDEIEVEKGLLANLATMFVGHSAEHAKEKRLPLLAERFKAFFDAVAKTGVPIRTQKDSKTKNIFLTAFPRLEGNRNGQICGLAEDGASDERRVEAAREVVAGMTMLDPSEWLTLNGEKMKAAAAFSDDLFNSLSSATDTHDAVFVTEHRDRFLNHGLCAQGVDAKTNPHERMLAPFFVRSGSSSPEWHLGYSAQDYDCYRSRQRWFRTFDDAFYCANTRHKMFPRNTGRDEFSVAFMSLGGPVHPTAEGHSHISDAVFNVIRGLEFVEERLEKYSLSD